MYQSKDTKHISSSHGKGSAKGKNTTEIKLFFENDKLFDANGNEYKYEKKKKVVKKMVNRKLCNYHVWVEKLDNQIYDPYFSEYNMIKTVNGIHKNASRVYDPIKDPIKRKKIWNQMWKSIINQVPKKDRKIVINIISDVFYERPRFNNCIKNAFAYQKKEGGVIKIGKMGWKTLKGDIYWEYEGL